MSCLFSQQALKYISNASIATDPLRRGGRNQNPKKRKEGKATKKVERTRWLAGNPSNRAQRKTHHSPFRFPLQIILRGWEDDGKTRLTFSPFSYRSAFGRFLARKVPKPGLVVSCRLFTPQEIIGLLAPISFGWWLFVHVTTEWSSWTCWYIHQDVLAVLGDRDGGYLFSLRFTVENISNHLVLHSALFEIICLNIET